MNSNQSLLGDVNESRAIDFESSRFPSSNGNGVRRKSISDVSVSKITLDNKIYPVGNPSIKSPNRVSDEEPNALPMIAERKIGNVKVTRILSSRKPGLYNMDRGLSKHNMIESMEVPHLKYRSGNGMKTIRVINSSAKPASATHKSLVQYPNDLLNGNIIQLNDVTQTAESSSPSGDIKRNRVTVIRVPSTRRRKEQNETHSLLANTPDLTSNKSSPIALEMSNTKTSGKLASSIHVTRVQTAKIDSSKANPILSSLAVQSTKHSAEYKTRDKTPVRSSVIVQRVSRENTGKSTANR